MSKEKSFEMIDAENLGFSYHSVRNDLDKKVVSSVNFKIKKGEYVAVVGKNGSGKSTLAKLMNALLLPKEGAILVDRINTKNKELTWEIRKIVGMVFQNPDNQIVGTTVEEEVAFGPENLGVEPEEIEKRIKQSLALTGMEEYRYHYPHHLSGGQKQRLCIAGVLSMHPKCIILDEATSMLDPLGREKVLKILHELNKEKGITVIHITHHMEEALLFDRVIVMEQGSIRMDDIPERIFSDREGLEAIGLILPPVAQLMEELRKEGMEVPEGILEEEEAFHYLKKLVE